MFKPADRTRRTPAWLQKNTKENLIWQLAMLVLFVGTCEVKSRYDEHKRNKNS